MTKLRSVRLPMPSAAIQRLSGIGGPSRGSDRSSPSIRPPRAEPRGGDASCGDRDVHRASVPAAGGLVAGETVLRSPRRSRPPPADVPHDPARVEFLGAQRHDLVWAQSFVGRRHDRRLHRLDDRLVGPTAPPARCGTSAGRRRSPRTAGRAWRRSGDRRSAAIRPRRPRSVGADRPRRPPAR